LGYALDHAEKVCLLNQMPSVTQAVSDREFRNWRPWPPELAAVYQRPGQAFRKSSASRADNDGASGSNNG